MSIEAVAKAAGVSVATVSRTFNLPDQVTPQTRTKVESAARRLGYIPDQTARTLRTRRSRVVGVVLPTLLNPVFAECLEGIAAAANAAGYAISPFTTEYDQSKEAGVIDALIGRRVDGAILVVSDPLHSAALARLVRLKLPYVLAYNRHPKHPCVSVDSERAVADLVLRLHGLGHRRIAMVSGQRSASDRAQQRYRGYRSGMRSCGLGPGELIEVSFVQTAVVELAQRLRRAERPTALVCSNDLLAIRAIRAARLAGLQVPRDISVVGFDGIAIGEDTTPMLSTIVQPNAEIGRRSLTLLVDALAHGGSPRADASLCLRHGFRDGESCAAAPRPSPTGS